MTNLPSNDPPRPPRFEFAKRHARRFWGARSNRWLVAIASLWLFLISIPFAFFGVQGWGPAWYMLAQPFSHWLKSIYQSGGVVGYVAAITLLSGLQGLVALFITWWTGVKTVRHVRQWRAKRRQAGHQ